MGKKRLLAVAVCSVVFLALFASTALAGEVTGSGKNSEQNQGVSWCSFSGLNDEPDRPLDGFNPGGTSQSFGQENRLGLADPHEFNPGMACNPNHAPDFGFPPQPNRTNTWPEFPRT